MSSSGEQKSKSTLHYIAAGIGGSVGAGSVVGFAEGLSVFLGDPAAGAAAPVYGAVFYALLLGAFGVPAGIVAGVAAKLGVKRWSQLTPGMVWAGSFGAFLLPVALVVLRFRVIRDVFHEKLAIASGVGIGVHVGLLVVAAVLGAAIWFLLTPGRALGRFGPLKLGVAFAVVPVLAGLPVALFNGGNDAGAVPVAAADGNTKPRILLIMIDTLRADRLGSYGYARAKTPHLDAFAEESIQFDHAFANASWTRPSVATMLTSLPPSAHAVMYKADRLPDDVVTIGEALDGQGYVRGGIVTNYNIAPYFNFGQGFDDYRYLEPDYYFWADEGSSKLSLFNLVRVVREKVAPSSSPAQYYQDADVTTTAAISWIDQQGDNPWFLCLTYMDPHDPYFARPLDGESYSRAANVNPDPAMAQRFSELYDGEISYFDEHFGRLVAHLKDSGQWDNTIIIVTSDHGEEFQEHGGWWHGTTLYEEQIHVPMIVKPAGGRGDRAPARADLASLLDVAPTLLAASGAPAPESWRGRDLLSPELETVEAVYAEEDHQGNVLRALRGKTWKLIEANEDNPRGLAPVELYRIDFDPLETRNEVERRPAALADMQKKLDAASTGAAEGAVERVAEEIDEASQERLKSLGYVE